MASSYVSTTQFFDLKGDAGEKIIAGSLKQWGMVVFTACHKFEMFDFVILSNNGDPTRPYKLIAYADAKTKPRRLKYDDTGLDLKSYNRYKWTSENTRVPFWVFFIDVIEEAIFRAIIGKQIPHITQTCSGTDLAMFWLRELDRYPIPQQFKNELRELEKQSEDHRPYKYYDLIKKK